MFPDWRGGNPYQRLLAEALRPLGVDAAFAQGYRRGLPFSRQVLARPRPDVLHLHWPTPYLRSDRTALRAAYCVRVLGDLALVQKAGIAVVWTVHNLVTHDTPTPRLERWFSGRLARLADRLIVHSTAAAEAVVSELGALPGKVAVIPHGPLAPAYGPSPPRAAARAALGLAPDVPIALFFGMIRPYKGVPNLLRAWTALGPRRGGALLLIAGEATDPNHAAEVEQLAAQTPGVRLALRRIGDDEIPTLMAAADLIVLPFEKSLTSGTVRLAQDYGLPFVVSRVVGAAVAGGAILAEDTRPEGLAEAIVRGLGSVAVPQPRTPVAGSTWSEIARQHEEVFRAVLAGRARHAAVPPNSEPGTSRG
jgi:glycosyltransferase involved in cell wall biosynthesis